ncbi:MAG: hypothetical protein FWH22_10000 [Fibromonadales bacterium]|nr:hypothetical protein [Fibromonadales bacterium]
MFKICSVLFFALFAGMAFSTTIMKNLHGVQCASGEFRGVGVAKNESEALALARSMIANQIQSSVSVRTESRTEQQTRNGKEELLKRDNLMQTEQKSQLLNAQDAQIKHSVAMDGNAGVVACMSRENAAKPYLARQNQIADTLSMLAKAFPAEKRPKQKKDIWQKTSDFYNKYMEIERILQSLGKAEEFEAIRNLYELVKNDYQKFCSSQEIYWKDADSYGSKILISKFSKEFMLNTEVCKSGLQISLLDAEIQCEYKASLGNHLCLFRPALKGESCSGETFFQLTLSPALSTANKVSRSAESKLESKIRSHDFSDWKQELKKWVSICVE